MNAPRTFGKYVVIDRLGRGGMGVVYRARDPGTGQEVAVKTVRTASSMQLASIRREAAALARVSHPGIVRVLDTGTTLGVPWYAMELLSGQTLRELMAVVAPRPARPAAAEPTTPLAEATAVLVRGATQDLPQTATPPEPRARLTPEVLRGVLTRARRICRPLAYLHGEGFVHRDLKPENVVWRDDHPVLVDFGLLGQFGGEISREVADVSLEIAGTAAYMAPEQRLGALVDARADLYALGVILHEMLTGVPWTSDSLPAGHLVDGIPEELDQLVALLVAPEPAQRIGHADDVERDLAALGADPFMLPAAPARSYLYRPALEGRRDTLDALLERVSAAGRGEGALLLIRGESGVGKTRLAMELAGDAASRGFDVLVGEHTDPASSPPLGALRPLFLRVAPVLAARADEDPEAALCIGVLAAHEPAIAALARTTLAPLPPEASRRRLVRAVESALRIATREQPLFLIVDDVQWADELTLEALAHLCGERALPRIPAVIAATMRAEGAFEPPRRPWVAEVTLERLDADAVRRMVARMLGVATAPAELAKDVAAQSEGNPLFAAEYLRLALEQGRLHRDPRGRWRLTTVESTTPLPVPRSVKELIAMRLAVLPRPLRQLVAVASAVGRDVEEATLAELSDLPEAEAGSGVDALVRHHVLERTTSGLRFTHDKVREMAYEGLEPSSRPALHRRIALTLERRSRGAADAQARIARQWELAGELERARPAYLRAARHALAKEARSMAEQWYRAALRLAPPPGDPETALEMIEEVLVFEARRQEATAELSSLLRTLHGSDRRLVARTQRLLGSCAARQGSYDEGIDWLQRAAVSAAGLPLEPRILANLADIHRERGDLARAMRACDEAEASLERADDPAAATHVLRTRGSVAMEQGHIGEACRILERVLERYRAAGDRFLEAVVVGNLGNAFCVRGEFHEAERRLREAIRLHGLTGSREFEGVARSNHGAILSVLGRSEEAVTEGERALELLAGGDDARSLALAHFSLGESLASSVLWAAPGSALALESAAARARHHLEEASASFERLGLHHRRPAPLSLIARLLRVRGAPEEEWRRAVAAAKEALASAPASPFDAGWLLGRADLAELDDDLPASREDVDACLALLRPSEQRLLLMQALELAARLDVRQGRPLDLRQVEEITALLALPEASPHRRSLARIAAAGAAGRAP